jgi:hypothetical protein
VASAYASPNERVAGDAMSAASAVWLIASGVQGGHARPLGYETFVIVSLIVVMTLACVAIGIYLRRRQRHPKPVADQWQALAVMGELCPHGWQAQITLYGWGAPIPPDAPPSRVPLIELEWTQYDEPGHIAIARRVWAPTISQALQAMIEDRQTDITLEQIEQAANNDQDTRRNE